jgi:hypothetical protein
LENNDPNIEGAASFCTVTIGGGSGTDSRLENVIGSMGSNGLMSITPKPPLWEEDWKENDSFGFGGGEKVSIVTLLPELEVSWFTDILFGFASIPRPRSSDKSPSSITFPKSSEPPRATRSISAIETLAIFFFALGLFLGSHLYRVEGIKTHT